jgi:cell division protease FtsH
MNKKIISDDFLKTATVRKMKSKFAAKVLLSLYLTLNFVPALAAEDTVTKSTTTSTKETSGKLPKPQQTPTPEPTSWGRDKNGLPYLEEAKASSNGSEELIRNLVESGEVDQVLIDDKMKLMLFTTYGGVYVQMLYDSSDVAFTQFLLDKKVTLLFHTFVQAPNAAKPEVMKEKEKTEKQNYSLLLRMLPILIMISGIVIIFEIRQHKKRKPAEDGKTIAFQTREGPGGFIPTVTFADVAGCEEAIEDLSEIVEFLKNPEKFEKLGAKIPRGAILAGPPGTGKTLLARAVAGEAKVPFFAASGSDFVEMYVGVGPMRVRELFTKARLEEKAIVFIDEIDAVARSRVTSVKQNANDERENTLNALLNELDGFSRGNVILIAATNRVDILDPAILRPGRLDRKVQVPNPDRRGREAILAVHADGKPLAKDVSLSLIARRTPGMSGADLAQIVNEAAIEAARKNRKSINAECFSSAVAMVAMGRARRSALVTDRDRLITAWHEAGHTVAALMHAEASNPMSVSIIPRGHAGGITWMSGSDDQFMSRNQAIAQLVVAMAGRVGEEMLLDGEFTQGPSSDLERATSLAGAMVTRYGMSRRGLAVRPGEPDSLSNDVIEEILNSALVDARIMLDTNKELVQALVNQLLEVETLEYHEILEIAAAVDGNDFTADSVRGILDEFKDDSQNVINKARKRLKNKSKITEMEEKFTFSQPEIPKTKKTIRKRKAKEKEKLAE